MRILVRLAAIAALAMSCVVLSAQAPKPATSTGLILGKVIDDSTGQPVPSATVTLIFGGGTLTGPMLPGGPSPQTQRVISDGTGRFLFRDLLPGRYNFSVSGVGSRLGGAFGVRRPGGATQPLELADNEKVTDVTLRVWKFASISGTVVDHLGDPLVESKVAALRVEYVAGRRRYRSAGAAMTDDRGQYRLSRLEPGEYVAYLPFTQVTLPLSIRSDLDKASQAGRAAGEEFQSLLDSSGAPMVSGTGFRVDDFVLLRASGAYGMSGPIGPMFSSPAPASDGHVSVYPIQYYPSAARPADAAILTLESGRDRSGTDFQTRLVPSVRVSGHVLGPSGPVPAIGIRLVSQWQIDAADESATEVAVTIADSSGAFTFLGVSPGQYVLRAARVPVARRPMTQTSVTMMGPGGGVTSFGAAADAGLPPLPLPDAPTLSASVGVGVGETDVTNLDVVLQTGPRVSGQIEYDGSKDPLTTNQLLRVAISLDPADGRSFTGSRGYGQFDASGHFKTAGLVAGSYTLRISGDLGGWTFGAAAAGGRDISDEPVVVEGRDIGGVVIRLTDHPSRLSGIARDAAGAVDKTADVLLFPVDRRRWTDQGASPRRERLTRASSKGAYEFVNMPASDYFLVAVSDEFTANWQDPRQLDVLSRSATRVTVADGERKTMDLTTARIR